MEEEQSQGRTFFKEVWLGICPPKIEIFTWQLLHGRTLVKDVLSCFGLLFDSSLECQLCQGNRETIDHLFLHCKWTWRVWQKCISWWGFSCCVPSSLIEWWRGWPNLCTLSKSTRAWKSLFFAVVWSVWEVRNN